jgi:L-2-hydroxyglutarate oxidase LhgO
MQSVNLESREYDVVVIGGGILGLSTTMQLGQRYPRVKIAVVEKEDRLATHQTGHNSGVIHSGIYYRPGSWKSRFCVAGVQKLVQFCDENEIEYERCGKAIVATHASELGRLEDLYQRGVANGVAGLELVGPDRLREIEPHTVGVQALWAPNTGIVDYVRVANAYANRFQNGGGDIFTGAPVQGVTPSGDGLAVTTQRGTLIARNIINCAGLYADRVARMTGEKTDVQIIPFRGEYYTLRPESRHLVKGLIYPVPDPRFPFLGVHYTRNIHGGVEAGPNAVLAWAREGYTKSSFNLGETLGAVTFPGFWKMSMKHWKTGMSEMHRSYSKSVFVKDLQKLIPEIRAEDLASGGAGVRAQAVDRDGALLDDFSILRGRHAVHVLNAPSPGATSSLAIGEHLVDLAVESFGISA